MNFNEFFRKNVTCDNIKSQKIRFLENTISEKPQGGQIHPPASLGLSLAEKEVWQRCFPGIFTHPTKTVFQG